MRTTLIVLLLCLAACNRSGGSAKGDGASHSAGPRKSVVLLFSGTSETQWDAELLAAVGARLDFDPYAKRSDLGHLDILGPYDTKIGDTPVALSIAFTGLSGMSGLQSQEDLAVDARAWIDGRKPHVLWLDGDQSQFFIGRELAGEVPIVFSGVVSDRQTYYAEGATGVYERPSLPRLLELIWERDPKADSFTLLSDAAPLSRGRVSKFRELLQAVLGESGKVTIGEPAADWTQLKAQIAKAQARGDAVIVAGVGEDEGGDAFRKPCLDGLLEGIKVPVVAVGGSDAGSCFSVVVRLKASEHAKYALGMVAQVLEDGDPGAIPTITPEEMNVTLLER